jgi:hypothetical protein
MNNLTLREFQRRVFCIQTNIVLSDTSPAVVLPDITGRRQLILSPGTFSIDKQK